MIGASFIEQNNGMRPFCGIFLNNSGYLHDL